MLQFLKKNISIATLLVISVALAWYFLRASNVFGGVAPRGNADSAITIIAALAGAITTLAGAISGAAMKWLDYKKGLLEIEESKLKNEKIQRDLESQ